MQDGSSRSGYTGVEANSYGMYLVRPTYHYRSRGPKVPPPYLGHASSQVVAARMADLAYLKLSDGQRDPLKPPRLNFTEDIWLQVGSSLTPAVSQQHLQLPVHPAASATPEIACMRQPTRHLLLAPLYCSISMVS